LMQNVSRHTRSSSSKTSANGCSRVSESRSPLSAPRCGVPPLGRTRARHWVSPSVHLRRGLLHLAGRGFCRPPAMMPSPLPRVYLVSQARWSRSFSRTPDAGPSRCKRRCGRCHDRAGRVARRTRSGPGEFPLMVAWAFGLSIASARGRSSRPPRAHAVLIRPRTDRRISGGSRSQPAIMTQGMVTLGRVVT
jgi:hypothetical protein